MSRTRLFAQVTRALQMATHFRRREMSTVEGLERLAEARWSRRQFLKTTAVAATGAALGMMLPRGPVLAGLRPRVVIIGAGCAGLTCAYRLQQWGVPSRVLEAGTRVGGRMHTLRGVFPDGQLTELGGEFIDTNHTSLINLVQDLGLTLVDLRETDGDLEDEFFYFDNRRVPFQELVEDFQPVAEIILEDLSTIIGFGQVTYRHPHHAQALDRLSLAEWFDSRGITGVIREVLEVVYIAEYGREADEQSALNLLLLIGTDPGTFNIVGDSDVRYHIAEGNDSVPTQLAAQLRAAVELDTRLLAIRQSATGTYHLTINQAGAMHDISADEVVLAIPFTMLRQVDIQVQLPQAKRLAIDTLGYGTNAKVIAGVAERVWQQVGSNGSSVSDLPYQTSWDTTRGQDGVHGLLTNFGGGDRGVAMGGGTPQAQAADFLNQIDRLFPGAKTAYTGQAVRFHWPTNPLVLGSYACYQPGQYTTIAGAERESVGGLHFAGEHTSLNFQGFMNGACQSGERAAAKVFFRAFRQLRVP